MARRSIRRLIPAALFLLALTGQESPKLVLNTAVEREMAGGQVHNYQVALSAGQFLRAIVDQRGIDVVVTVFAPDGGKVTEVDGDTGAQGPENVWLVAPAAGTYRLQIAALDKEAPAGKYEVKIQELRAATQSDRDRMAAEQGFQEAEQLKSGRNPEAMRKAIEKYQEVRRLWQKVPDRLEEATTVNNLAFTYEMLNEIPKALATYEEALPIWREIAFHQGEGFTLENIGRIYKNRGETARALEFHLQALSAFRAAQMPLREGIARNNIGLIYSESGENQKAIEYYQEAVRLFRSVSNRQEEATTLTSIGRHYDLIGEKRKAVDYLNQALGICRTIKDRQREALTLNILGLVYDSMGESEQALSAHRTALQLFKAVNDRRGEASSTNNLGLLYAALGERDRALEHYEQALKLFRTIGDKRREAAALSNTGMIYAEAGDHQRALQYFAQALPLSQGVGDRRMAATELDNAGSALLELGDRQKALDRFGEALALRRETEDPRGEANTLSNLGRAYAQLADSGRALDYFNQALSIRRTIRDRRGEAATLYETARMERDRGNLTKARDVAVQARDIVETLRSKVDSQDLRAAYFASVQDYFGLETDVLMRLHEANPSQGFQSAALHASERARARVLLETLGEARIGIREGVDPALLERERELQAQLNAQELARTRMLVAKHTPEQGTAAEKAVRDLTVQYDEIRAQIRSRSPRYAALTSPSPLNLEAIQHEVLDADTILLEYALGDQRSFLWAVSSNGIASVFLPKRSEIEQAARLFYDSLANAGGAASPDAGKALSRMLLGGVSATLGGKRLLVVADGALQYLPFAALPDPDGYQQPLVVNHEIVNVPSASTLAVLRRENLNRKPAPKMLAILADPVFSADDSRLTGGPNRKAAGVARDVDEPLERALSDMGLTGSRVSRLPGTRREAAGIAALVPEAQRRQALDFDASRQTLMGPDIGEYRILHLATHGLLNAAHPELSGIVLSLVDKQGKPQDGFLRLHEIYNLKLSASLVVLSACQTGLGKEIKGEGLVGLTRGFMYAGAPRVLASLWKVDDRATAELMKEFYGSMLGEKRLSPAASLRAAQTAMWKTKGWEAPYYWAAFVLEGDWK